jgi:hypothetical protein
MYTSVTTHTLQAGLNLSYEAVAGGFRHALLLPAGQYTKTTCRVIALAEPPRKKT